MLLDSKNLPDTQDVVDRVKYDMYQYGITSFSRFLPSSLDGFKPIHRRILYTIWQNNINGSVKVNKLSGLTISLHPHGDVSISDAIIKMAQDGTTANHALLKPEGSFGTISDLSAASPRYISVKLSDFGYDAVISLMDSHTLEMKDAESDFGEKEPAFLPTKIPIVLLNGSLGIVLSFTSDVPQHNLNDIADIVIKYIKNKNVSAYELGRNLYPDYVVGGVIINGDDIPQSYYDSSRDIGVVRVRSDVEIDSQNNRILVKSMPLSYDFDSFIDKVKKIMNEKDGSGNPKNLILSNISYIGESKDNDKSNPYVYITCKTGTNLAEVLENLYKYTDLEHSNKLNLTFNCNGRVKRYDIKEVIADWYSVNYDLRRRKITHSINVQENKVHILEGLLIVYPNIDKVIDIIKKSTDSKDSIILLLKNKFNLSLIQAKGIFEMQIGSLTKRSEGELQKAIDKIKDTIKSLTCDLTRVDDIMIDDLIELKKKYGRPRRTKIIGKLKEREDIIISNGAILATRNSIGIFDSSNVISGKKILNGLKGIKIDNVWVKGIISSHKIDNNIKNVAVFYEKGGANIISPSITNAWMPAIQYEETGFIKAVCPIYNSIEGSVVCITSNGLLKRFDLDSMTSRVVNIGSIVENCIFVPEDCLKDSTIVLVNNNGEYLHIKTADIPLQGRSAQGVKTSFNGGIGVHMTLANKSFTHFVMLLEHTKLSDGFVFIRPIDEIPVTSKTAKLRLIHSYKDFKCNGMSTLDINMKDQLGLFISESSTMSLKISNLRNLKEPRKISCKAIDLIVITC